MQQSDHVHISSKAPAPPAWVLAVGAALLLLALLLTAVGPRLVEPVATRPAGTSATIASS